MSNLLFRLMHVHNMPPLRSTQSIYRRFHLIGVILSLRIGRHLLVQLLTRMRSVERRVTSSILLRFQSLKHYIVKLKMSKGEKSLSKVSKEGDWENILHFFVSNSFVHQAEYCPCTLSAPYLNLVQCWKYLFRQLIDELCIRRKIQLKSV